MKFGTLTFFLTLITLTSLFSQKKDPILFKAGNQNVHLSEFKYIYEKTNGSVADFSKASLQEYLDLYVNFKLKVQKAKDMRLDTIDALIDELAGYRRQLADSYLIDREVTEKLVKEAYERSRFDVEVSHILFSLPENSTPEDTLQAWKRCTEVLEKLKQEKDFGEMALMYSNDPSVKDNKGYIGFVNVLFPNGFYALETAAYASESEKITGPIKTSQGYHILKVHNKRPARGEIEVLHILIRLEEAASMVENRLRIDSIYGALRNGANFEELARKYSQDQFTAEKGGYIGFFGINRYEKGFEDAAYAIPEDGGISPVTESSIGWHIIKRISLKNNEPFAQLKAKFQNAVKEDARFQLAKQAMVERIKKESQFKETRTTLEQLIHSLESDTSLTFLTYKWKAPEKPSPKTLFSFGKDLTITEGDFANYLQRSSRQRQQLSELGIRPVVELLYEEYIGENALKYEEKNLELKYPEFKSLMREYEEGVLLFEVTKMEVWDKASLDTVGLQKFYEENKQRYQWEERVLVSQYTLSENAKDLAPIVRNFCQTRSSDEVLQEFNREESGRILYAMEKIYEKGRNEVLEQLPWKVGSVSPVEISRRDGSANFFKIEKILPPGQKSLQDARGYVVADYQDFLEKQWMQQLKKDYKVSIKKRVFNRLISK